MSDDTYSTYEAKARFSEVLRLVRGGRTVTVTYRGEPVAEIRPVQKGKGTAARVRRLRERGVVVPSETAGAALTPLAPRPGALERFLRDRDEG